MKYILFDFLSSSVPILFPDHIGHDEINRMVKAIYPGVKAKSAGFVSITAQDNRYLKSYVERESTSLKLKPDKEDTRYIDLMINQY